MKKMIYTVLFIATGFLISSPVHAKTASEVFDAVSLSIVVILTWDVNGKNLGFGSGVVIPGGSVATSFHVVKDAAMIKVLYRQKEYQATLHYIDWDRDVCTLIGEDFNAPAVSMGSTSRLKVGKRVFAIGAPQGLELTLSEGIISGLRPVAGGQYIQTTASISPGSSGGGLFDEEGRLIGLTTFYLTEGQQLNFAVPVEWIDELPDRSKEIAKSSLILSTDWLNKEALALEKKKDWAGLINHSLQWIKAQPEDFSAWFYLGFAFHESRQYSEAIEAYQQAIRIEPEDAVIWYNLGLAFGHSGQSAKAKEAFQQAIRIDPENAEVWFNLGVTFSISGQTAKAIEAYQQAIRIEPELGKAWYNLGLAFDSSGQYPKAIEVYQQAIRIDPDNAKGWHNLGILFHNSGQYSKAIEAYQQVIRIEPNHAKAWYHLGWTYKTINNTGKVTDVYKRLKVLDPALADAFFANFVLP